MSTDDIMKSLGTDKGSVDRVNFDRIRPESKRSNTSKGLKPLADEFSRRAREQRAEEVEEERKQKASDQLQAELAATAGVELPEDASEAYRSSYKQTQYMIDAQDTFNDISEQFQSDDFQELAKDKREAMYAELRTQLVDSLARHGVDKEDGAVKATSAMLQKLDLNYRTAEHKYNTVILPQRTLSMHSEQLTRSTADEASWDKLITSAFNDGMFKGNRTDEEVGQQMAAEVSRAVQTGNLNAFKALEKSEHFNTMDARLRNSLTTTYQNKVAEIQKQTMYNTADSIERLFLDGIENNDLTAIEQANSRLEALPSQMRYEVQDKVERARNDAQKLTTTMSKFGNMQQGRLTNFTEAESDTLFNMSRHNYMKTSTASDQLSAYAQTTARAALDVIDTSTPSKALKKEFDLSGVLLTQDGEVDTRTLGKLSAMDMLFNRVGEQRLREFINPDDVDAYKIIRNAEKRGMTREMAVAHMKDVADQRKAQKSFMKGEELEQIVNEVNQAGFFESVIDDIRDPFAAIASTASNGVGGFRSFAEGASEAFGNLSEPLRSSISERIPSEFKDQVKSMHTKFMAPLKKLKDKADEYSPVRNVTIGDVELVARAPLKEGANEFMDYQTMEQTNALAQKNMLKLQMRMVNERQSRGFVTNTELLGETNQILESAVVANNNLLIDPQALRVLGADKGGDRKRHSKRISEGFQLLSILSTRTPAGRNDILTQVLEREDKEPVTLEDVQAYMKGADIALKLNRDKYVQLLDDEKVLAAAMKSTGARTPFSKAFIPHTLDYDGRMNAFVLQPIDDKGQPIIGRMANSDGTDKFFNTGFTIPAALARLFTQGE